MGELDGQLALDSELVDATVLKASLELQNGDEDAARDTLYTLPPLMTLKLAPHVTLKLGHAFLAVGKVQPNDALDLAHLFLAELEHAGGWDLRSGAVPTKPSRPLLLPGAPIVHMLHQMKQAVTYSNAVSNGAWLALRFDDLKTLAAYGFDADASQDGAVVRHYFPSEGPPVAERYTAEDLERLEVTRRMLVNAAGGLRTCVLVSALRANMHASDWHPAVALLEELPSLWVAAWGDDPEARYAEVETIARLPSGAAYAARCLLASLRHEAMYGMSWGNNVVTSNLLGGLALTSSVWNRDSDRAATERARAVAWIVRITPHDEREAVAAAAAAVVGESDRTSEATDSREEFVRVITAIVARVIR